VLYRIPVYSRYVVTAKIMRSTVGHIGAGASEVESLTYCVKARGLTIYAAGKSYIV
jgi:hypothetical protein